ncbi:MAG: hypothetical protein K2L46_04985, partial [Paramuribaculum sp.]|nr:hypothetical protein [Paramuribaculum sp.]
HHCSRPQSPAVTANQNNIITAVILLRSSFSTIDATTPDYCDLSHFRRITPNSLDMMERQTPEIFLKLLNRKISNNI